MVGGRKGLRAFLDQKPRALADFRRIVVKVGSSCWSTARRAVRADWLVSLAEDMAALHKRPARHSRCSSGAIALGRAVLKLPRGSLRLEEAATLKRKATT